MSKPRSVLVLSSTLTLLACQGQPLDAEPVTDLPQGLTAPQLPPPPSFPTTTFVVNSTNDVDDGTCDATHCSLREAIRSGNLVANFPTIRLVSITFDLPLGRGLICTPTGPVFCTTRFFAPPIVVGSELPAIKRTMFIDGTTQSTFGGTPVVEVRGQGTTVSIATGLRLVDNTAGIGSVIRGLSLTNFGVALAISSDGNSIVGNLVGLEPGGATRANTNGLFVHGDGNRIGGNTVGDRNVISGNTAAGVTICAGCLTTDSVSAANNKVLGNFIGTDLTGKSARGNQDGIVVVGTSPFGSGVFTGASGTIIGGPTRAHGNVISGNTRHGVFLHDGPSGTRLGGNLIGLNAAGTAALPNGQNGLLATNVDDTVAGTFRQDGVLVTTGNVVSGNGGNGMSFGPLVTRGAVLGNLIGLDGTGLLALGNGGHGVRIGQSTDLLVGDTDRGNTIAFNLGDGVNSAFGGSVRFNRIFSNGGLAFDLGTDGPGTLSGLPGSDHDPQLSGATTAGGVTTVDGSVGFRGESPGFFAIDYYASPACDDSGFGEGQTYLGTQTVELTSEEAQSADASVSLHFALPAVAAGQVITATRTSLFAPFPGGRTGELSRCVTVTGS